MAKDLTTQAALYKNHQYIAGFLMVCLFAHGAIFSIREDNPTQNENNILNKLLKHKEAIISNLSCVSLFLEFRI